MEVPSYEKSRANRPARSLMNCSALLDRLDARPAKSGCAGGMLADEPVVSGAGAEAVVAGCVIGARMLWVATLRSPMPAKK